MLPSKTITPRQLLVRVADRAALVEESFRHPLDAASELHGYALSRQVGLERNVVMLARVPPHRESYAAHVHAGEEEWLFVLEGRGILAIADESYEIGPGDFVGFPPGSYAHNVRNPDSKDLVYLCGGDRRDVDVVDYPAAGRRVVRVGGEMTVYPARAGEPLFP
jgi:uncharacterized cupin superfamily protein